MANNYYNFSPSFVPGTKVRSDQVNTQYQALETAFDLLPTDTTAIARGTATFGGTTTGAGDAFEVALTDTRASDLVGDEIIFIADRANTGAATLEVDGNGARDLVRADGSALEANDLQLGLIYAARYDATNTRWQLTTPSVSYLTNAAASAAAAAVSETNAATSEGNAATSETNASTSETNAANSESLANEWAENPEDVAITGNPGEFSALHWAAKAAGASGLPVTANNNDTLYYNAGWQANSDVTWDGSTFDVTGGLDVSGDINLTGTGPVAIAGIIDLTNTGAMGVAGVVSFTGTSQRIINAAPRFGIQETDASADEQAWELTAQGGQLSLGTVTDAFGAGEAFLNVLRSGTTVTEVELNSALLDVNATNIELTGAMAFTGDMTLSGDLRVEATTADIRMVETDAAADEGLTRIRHSGGTFSLQARSDDDASGNTFFSAQRTGINVDELQFDADLFDFNGAGDFSGAVTFAAAGSGGTSAINLTGDTGVLRFSNSAAPADEANYELFNTAGSLTWRTRTDANGAGETFFLVTRTGTTVDEIEFNALLFDFNGAMDLAGDLDLAGALTVSAGSPNVHFIEVDATADNGEWRIIAAAENLNFQTRGDGGAAGNNYMRVLRTGTTVDEVEFNATLLDLNATTTNIGTDFSIVQGDAVYLTRSGDAQIALRDTSSAASAILDLLEGSAGFGVSGSAGARVSYDSTANDFRLRMGNGTTVIDALTIDRDGGYAAFEVEEITNNGTEIGLSSAIVKDGNTATSNDASLNADPDLTLTPPVEAVDFKVELYLQFVSMGLGGFRYDLVIGSGSETTPSYRVSECYDSTSLVGAKYGVGTGAELLDSTSYATIDVRVIKVNYLLRLSTAGAPSITLHHAQETANAGGYTLAAGSYVKVTALPRP